MLRAQYFSRRLCSSTRLTLYLALIGWSLLWMSLFFIWHANFNTRSIHPMDHLNGADTDSSTTHAHRDDRAVEIKPACSRHNLGSVCPDDDGGTCRIAHVDSGGGHSEPTDGTVDAGPLTAAAGECERRAKQRFQRYAETVARSDRLRSRHGPLRIAAFSRLWPPPLHGRGGMQYHAHHLYSQLAARGHFVHVFVTGPPDGARCMTLFYAVSTATNELKEIKRTNGGHYGEFGVGDSSSRQALNYALLEEKDVRLVVQQVPSSRDSEYSVSWYANCLEEFTALNHSMQQLTRPFPGKIVGDEDSNISFSEIGIHRRRGFDVVHSESWAGVANMYQLGLPFAVTWHGSMLDWFRNEINLIVHNFRMKGKIPSDGTARRMKDLGNSVAFEAYALLAVPDHIVISDSAADDLAELNLVDPAAVHLIYNGVNPSNFRPNRAGSRIGFLKRHAREYLPDRFEESDRAQDAEVARLVVAAQAGERGALRTAGPGAADGEAPPPPAIGQPPGLTAALRKISRSGTFVVGCGGRLEGIKGHHQLAEAMRLVLSRHSNVVLLVAGSGPEQHRYSALQSIGLKVVLLGMLQQEELGVFYQSLDVFVDPFYQHHGLNTVMIEAVLSGVPLIATRLASSKTTVPCDAFGRTFALGDPAGLAARVVELKDDAVERALIGLRVRERAVAMFTSSTMASAYEEVLYGVALRPKPLVPLTGPVVCKNTYPAMCLREPGVPNPTT